MTLTTFMLLIMQLPQDVMHVLFEGVLPFETKLMISAFIQEKIFNLETLNDRCQHFMYGRAESRNRPPKDFQARHFSDASKKLPLSGNNVRVNLKYIYLIL